MTKILQGQVIQGRQLDGDAALPTLISVRTIRRPAWSATGANGTDIAENFFKKARVPAQCRRFVAYRADVRNQFRSRLGNRRDIACGVKTDL